MFFFFKWKNKGKPCGKVGHKFNDGTYCFAHYKQVTKQKIKMSAPKESKPQCCRILKNGNCKLKCFNNETGLCKRHDKLEQKDSPFFARLVISFLACLFTSSQKLLEQSVFLQILLTYLLVLPLGGLYETPPLDPRQAFVRF